MPKLLSKRGLCLHYEAEGEGEPVLLLHSVGLDLTWWDHVVEALRPFFYVLRVDLRGHGRSSTPPPPWSIGNFAEDAHALLETLDLAPAHIVGLSLGGMVAQQLSIDYPSDVRSLVLSGTAATFEPVGREILAERGTEAQLWGMAHVIEPTLERWFSKSRPGSDLYERCRQRLFANDVEVWAQTWHAISALDTLQRLPEITVPTLVITGDADTSTPPEAARTIANAILDSTLFIMSGGSHMAPYENPELFIPHLIKFLRTTN